MDKYYDIVVDYEKYIESSLYSVNTPFIRKVAQYEFCKSKTPIWQSR